MSSFKTGRISYGKSSFRTFIEKKYRYIDKTESIYRLISSYDCAFLSRPRRFGKTLLVDTLEEIFSGNKELFKGLAIYEKDYDWKSYPVIRLDMTKTDRGSPKELKASLCDNIKRIANRMNIDISSLDSTKTPRAYLSLLLESLKDSGKEAVVLIDEYDYPILSGVGIKSKEFLQDILEVLKDFYLGFKSDESCIHFLFLTGVTRLSYTTIFSGMNNLEDISFKEDFCDILGFRQDEFESYFSSEIEAGIKKYDLDREEFISKVKNWYDGYRFSSSSTSVYNPSDITLFFRDESKFFPYWINTGTPSFLVNILSKALKFDLDDEFKLSRGESFFLSNLKLEELDDKNNLLRLFYQTGYLTISSDNTKKDKFYLGFPNREVELAFRSYIVESVWKKDYDFFDSYREVGEALLNGNIEGFISGIGTVFKSFTPTPQKYHENANQRPIVLILKIAEARVYEQLHFGDGIADIVVETKDSVYIIELKIDEKADVAISQIEEKRYMDKYLLDPKYSGFRFIGIGLCFSSVSGQLIDSGWKEFNKQ